MCVAAQTAITVTSLHMFREKNRDMCMLFHAKNPVTFCTRIQTRNPLAFVCLMHNCVLCLVIVYLFVFLTDTLGDTRIFLSSTDAHNQNFVKLTLGCTGSNKNSTKCQQSEHSFSRFICKGRTHTELHNSLSKGFPEEPEVDFCDVSGS